MTENFFNAVGKSGLGYHYRGKAGNARFPVLLAVLLICSAALAFIFRVNFIPAPSQNKSEHPIITKPALSQPDADQTLPRPGQMTIGWLSVQNRWGNELSKIRAVVIDGIWLALPVKACLGGETWIFTADTGKRNRIEGGFWKKGDSVGLWHLAGVANGQFDIPAIPRWEHDKDTRWLSLFENGQPRPVQIAPVKKLHYFMQCSVDKSVNEPGVFIQDNKIVGWTFGDLQSGGYLWDVSGAEAFENAWLWVDDFYSITFANGREEYFAEAVAMKNASYLEQIEIFAKGLRLEPKLTKEDTPSSLRPDAILDHIRLLVAKLLETGSYQDFAIIFNDPFLIGLADTTLLADAVLETATSYGYENAVKLAVQALSSRSNSDEDQAVFTSLHSQLYLEWLGNLLDDGDMKTGWQVHATAKEYYPYDPEIHLIGVELALGENDWQQAERLLSMMQYPASLRNRVTMLETLISKLKSQAGKIIIRFSPGHNVITAKALINEKVEQQFVIDTGASLVTIPLSTAELLGIEIDARTPRQQIHTAGGVKIAPVVVLSSVELEGWLVHDVRAFVLDIPNQPQLGLLGLNFLNRFRMDLDTGKGILLLEPR